MAAYKHKKITKTCHHCHKDYKTTNIYQSYCSHKCASEHRKQNQHEAVAYRQNAWGIMPPILQQQWSETP